MGIIHVLDPQLTNMIAAGEVVDRPVNIVKECAENSLDAGASRIDIEVFEGGIEGIIISDDGCGMSYEDADMAFKRHATSKIRSEDELFAISTMGFRGEALPSIASVARVDLRTSNGEEGCEIRYEYGERTLYEKADAPRGCRIEVRGLFLRTPARFKYLKKPNYEFSIIADAVNKLALAHPEVRFSLKHDGRLVFQTTGRKDRREILYQMFGAQPAAQAVEFYRRENDFAISGYAIQPSISRASKNYIYLCLNGRTIRSWPIVKAVIEGYREYLPKERYPICFLNIETDFQLVDVNVHPNKLEVRISKEEYLSQLIIDTISDLFESEIQAPSIRSKKPAPEQLQADFDYPASAREGALKAQSDPSPFPTSLPQKKAEYNTGKNIQPNSYESLPEMMRPDAAYQNPQKTDSARGIVQGSERTGRQTPEPPVSQPSFPAGQKPNRQPSSRHSVPDFLASNLDASASYKNPNGPMASGSGYEAIARPGQNPERKSQPPLGEVREESMRPAVKPMPETRTDAAIPAAQPGYPAGQQPAVPASKKGNAFFRTLKIIGQLKDSYILCEGDEGLVIIDQHAAQERANFEKIQREFEKPVPVMQPLMFPLRLSLSASQMAALDGINEKTKPYGLHFEPIGQNSVVLREEPAWMSMVDRDKFLEDLFAWHTDHQDVDMKELRRHLIATCACHSSVRFHHSLCQEEMEKVLEDLAECEQPYHCPHGRPTVISMSLKELAKEFERA